MTDQHLIHMDNLSQPDILELIDTAQKLRQDPSKVPNLFPRGCGLMFFENSTRTQHSFYLAAARLKMIPLVANLERSSLSKGESVADMLDTWSALGIDVAVIRHQENTFCQQLAQQLKSPIRLINAGNGNISHPTQALLDCLSIHDNKTELDQLKIVLMGDIAHSRVAHSFIQAMALLGNTKLHWVGPAIWQSDDPRINCSQDIDQALSDADVIMCLRIQHERMQNTPFNDNHYLQEWGLTAQRLQRAKADAIVLHPGPINRGIEIASEVADGKQSRIRQQVENGLWMRMALLIKYCSA